MRFLCALALIVGWAAPARAASVRVLVRDVKSAPELAKESRRLTEHLVLALGKIEDITVISEAELALLIDHQRAERDLTLCGEGDCLAKLERAVDAEKLLTAQLARWGDGHLVSLSLTDLKSASIERGESCQADTIEEVERCAVELAASMFGAEPKRRDRFELPGGPTKMAVLDLESYGAEPELAGNLTQLLAIELRRIEGVEVISRDEVEAALAYEADKQIVQCVSDVECLIEIGGALGAEWLVMGAVGELGETFVIHLKLLRAQTAEVAHRISESYRGPPRHLAQAIRFATWRLAGKPVEGTGERAGEREVDREERALSLDGGAPLPLDRPLPRIAAGKHSLALSAEDHHRLSHEFYVEPDRTTTLHPELVPLPKAWYQEWWPWAIIGGAVAAAVTTSIVLAVDAPDNGTVEPTLVRMR